jgi:UDP-2,3-diacylglucosamine pyrophosphatase LpxH
MRHKKLIIISDLHIGGDESIDDFDCGGELISFLNHLERTEDSVELLILGDLLDLWRVKGHTEGKVSFIIRQHKKLFERFKKFGEKHRITVLAGNHDHAIAYKKKYQDDLAKYNIHIDSNQFFKREFRHKGKVFRIVGEHGNQVEPSTAFPDFSMPTNSSLAFHINKLFVYEVMELGNEKKSPDWVKDLDNIDTNLILYWFLSKYFYYELAPILRAILIPMFVLFGLAVPYFVFDIATDFYRPNFLVPLLNFFDTNWFFKGVIFLLYFDMVVVILLFFVSLVRKDFIKRLRSYGVQSLTEILLSLQEAYRKRAKAVCKGDNPYKEKTDFYVNGHTHIADLHRSKKGGFIHGDSGSWKKLMKRMSAYFNFPIIFVPYYDLSYITCSRSGDEINLELRSWPKEYKSKLTILERLTLKKRKKIPKPFKKDTCKKSLRIPLA